MDTELVTNTVGVANQQTSDNTVPAFAFGMSLFGGISSVDFWGLVQTDLHRKNLVVNSANLQVNYSNNLLLRENLVLAQENASQLYSINNQLGQLSEIIARKASVEERENFARELIYNINKMDTALSSNSDKPFVSFEAKSLLFLIEKNNISTASFTQIQDKEYFEKILNSLKLKAEDISASEQKELEGFVSIYTYGLSLLEEYRSEKHIKAINVPSDFQIPIKPERDPILDCEKEIEDEIGNQYKELGLFSNHLRNYINSTDELQTFFEKFYETKKNYEINYLKYTTFGTLGEAYNMQDKNEELIAKINCCSELINKYLELHPDLIKDYPKINIDTATQIIDYNELLPFYESSLEMINKNLSNYYADISYKFNNRVTNNKADEIKPKKKSLFGFFKK